MKEPSTFELILATSALLVHVEKLSEAILGMPANQDQSHKHSAQAYEAQLLAASVRASWPDTFRKPSEPLAQIPVPVPDCPHFSGQWFGQWCDGKPRWTYGPAGAPEICHCRHLGNPVNEEGNCTKVACPLGRKDPDFTER